MLYCRKNHSDNKKNQKELVGIQKILYFCIVNRLGYGVMVTLQILVLPFLVRVRVSQLMESA